MTQGLREHLGKLRRAGELLEVEAPVDLRYASAIIAKCDRAVLFKQPLGYSPQVLVSGIYANRKTTGVAFGGSYDDAWQRIEAAKASRIDPEIAAGSPAWEVVREGDDVDLSELPVPILAHMDGAPYISAAITGSVDPELGTNWGVYRYQLVDRNTLAIDLTTQNNMHQALKRAHAEGCPFGVTVNLGNHPFEFLAAAIDLQAGQDEMAVAGGLHRAPVELVKATTVDAMAIANSEYILEGTFLPDGWAHDEGRFGEFHGLLGSMHRNPWLRIHRLTHRRDAHLYTLQMAREINNIGQPLKRGLAHSALIGAGIDPVAVNISLDGCSAFHIIASINKTFPGAGKNAIAALLNVGIVKHVVVTDADIDVFDPQEVEWAIATRVRAEKDVIVIPGMGRAKPLDPVLPPGMDPMLISRFGIDATIPEGIPKSRYGRISYPHCEEIDLAEVVANGYSHSAIEETDVEALTAGIETYLRDRQPVYYMDVVDHFSTAAHRKVIQAMGRLYEAARLARDEVGRYLLVE